MKRIQTATVTRTIVGCDLCGEEGGKIRKCQGCGRDICAACGKFWYADPWTQTDSGDYPGFVCHPCNEMSLDLVEDAKKVNRTCEYAIASLESEWLKRCERNK